MDTLIFTCKTVTPLAMSGADGKTPELRPPGIKAALRFWWRALHGHLTIDELRKKEGEIFGDTKQRSKVLIKVIEDIDQHVISTPLLPHRTEVNRNATTNAFPQGSQFKIKLTTTSSAISADQLKSLFVLTCTLGGLGKRSRRGFGSIKVINVNNDSYIPPESLIELRSHIENLVPGEFEINEGVIISRQDSTKQSYEYPELFKIEIGKSEKTLANIGQATHEVKGKYRNKEKEREKEPTKYDLNIGSEKYGFRLASPVFISILSNELPIISTFGNEKSLDYAIQDELKSKIL